MKRILHIVGARPNFMKAAPIICEMAKYPDEFKQMLVHTGQHYDANMSQVFFDELGLPQPDINLEVKSGSHAAQTAHIMLRIEPIILEYKPDWVIVPGDVNSTLACALVASKLGIKLAHVEAGLRSADRTMPEELNRLVTDQLSDLLLTPSQDANENLLAEGIPQEKIHFVGNVMIDTLIRLLPKADTRWLELQERYCLDTSFMMVTLHRPSNVDNFATLKEFVGALTELSKQIQIIFPVHPRTRSRIAELGIMLPTKGILLTEPLGYIDFLALEHHATLVLTDSGGVQEETTYLGVPCLTARPNTERPVTITHGTNQLVESKSCSLVKAAQGVLTDMKLTAVRSQLRPELWDGRTATRIVQVLNKSLTP